VTKQPQHLGVGDARSDFPSIVESASEGARFIVTRYGCALCAIVPLSDLPESMRPEQEKPAKRRQ
jgi:antitoxin (DNA-binding transcriptional repressor) of toxin-antitoxin stability system